jgi:glycosyltransferase involved in cell wall biosynthesis
MTMIARRSVSTHLNILSLMNCLPHNRFGGDEARVLYFSRLLDKTAFRQTVCSIAEFEGTIVADPDSTYSQLTEGGTEVVSIYPTANAGSSWVCRALPVRACIMLGALCRLIRQRHVDILDVHLGGLALLLGWVASIVTGVPMVNTLYHEPKGWTNRIVGQLCSGWSEVLITDSRVRERELRRWLIRKDPVIEIIPTAVEPPTPVRPASEIRRELGIPDRKQTKVIGQVSRLIPFKGQMILLEGAKLVLELYPDAFFLICGHVTPMHPKFRDDLLSKAVQLGIENKVRICGYPGRIGDVWQLIDIHAHASMFDSLPVSVIEGMSLAKPAVVTAAGGIPDLVVNGETGIVVEPGDADAFARGLSALLADPATAARFGREARRRYETHFGPSVLTRRLEELFAGTARAGKTGVALKGPKEEVSFSQSQGVVSR